MRALALVDGEHYPDVVVAALAKLPHDVVGAVMLGGREKLRDGLPDYGVPLWDKLEDALAEVEVDIVVDLSDEPVVGPRRRFRLASRALASGIPYVGADFRLNPVVFMPYAQPALAVIGTGKRVGKTAVSGHVARMLSQSRKVVVVAMGRGGPAEPAVVDVKPTVEDLLALSRSGVHAASDYLEDAALAGVVTVGARRCGGGLAGTPFLSNVEEAAEIAASLGSRSRPPGGQRRDHPSGRGRAADHRRRRAPGPRDPLGPSRPVPPVPERSRRPDDVRGAAGDARAGRRHAGGGRRCRPPAAGDRDRAEAEAGRAGRRQSRRVLLDRARGDPRRGCASTSSASTARRSSWSPAISPTARRSTRTWALPRRDEAEVYLVEIKAAAIDVVAETAETRGIQVVFADNEVLPLPGEPDLDERVRALADSIAGQPAAAR